MALAWCFPEEATSISKKLLEQMDVGSAVVPGWWFVEIVNVLSIAERKRRIEPSQVKAFIETIDLLTLDVDNDASNRAFTHLLPLCRQYSLTSYDAIYLDLSARRQLPLATLDVPLAKAAKKLGISVLGR